MTVTQGGTRAHNLVDGLPCSNQLSYRITWQLSGWIWVLSWATRDPAEADTKLACPMGRVWRAQSITRGLWGHAPPWNFEKSNLWDLRPVMGHNMVPLHAYVSCTLRVNHLLPNLSANVENTCQCIESIYSFSRLIVLVFCPPNSPLEYSQKWHTYIHKYVHKYVHTYKHVQPHTYSHDFMTISITLR